jgi:hypothetical protein
MTLRIILFAYAISAALALLSLWAIPAPAHDWKRPDLDAWYSRLHRKGLTHSCCSKEDCHTTEAERRNGEWWARIGKPVIDEKGNRDWVLEDYVRIPDELIVRNENGLPVTNPEGEAVICHQIVWQGQSWMTPGGGVLDPEHTVVYCFVPGFES